MSPSPQKVLEESRIRGSIEGGTELVYASVGRKGAFPFLMYFRRSLGKGKEDIIVKRLITLTVLCALLLVVPAATADIVWDGGGDGTNWSSDGNWDTPPSAATGKVTIGNGYTTAVNADTTTWGITSVNVDNTNSVTVGNGDLLKMSNEYVVGAGGNGGNVLTVNSGGEVDISSNYRTAHLDQGTININDDATFSAGTLTLHGAADLFTMNISNSDGDISVPYINFSAQSTQNVNTVWDFTLDADGITPFDLTNADPFQDTTTTGTIDTTFNLDFDAYNIANGMVVPLFTFVAAETFDLTDGATINPSALPTGATGYTLAQDDDGIAITFIPEPATMSLFALGGIGMLIKRRRKA